MNTIARQPALPFTDPARTLDGSPRARVRLDLLETLWFNTGTRCNLTCENCYIESSPDNDRLSFLELADLLPFLDEIDAEYLPVRTLGYTGGEPFLNPAFMDILTLGLERGMDALVLTNAMRPMQQSAQALLGLKERFGERLMIRVSVDHFDPARHREERGRQSWTPMLRGLRWLSDHGFALSVAGRTRWGDSEAELRAGYAGLFEREGIRVDAHDPAGLILFPEMDPAAKVPEITEACWDILGRNPADMMCASSRMVVRRQGAPRPVVLACTLIPYDARFELGSTLAEALGEVSLNHVHCARFCVLGGGSCTG
ncbi:MAG: radical SAM protein [Gammaproteobacteria bacterium]|nr:radical SAM protein [Gammaproteobacteria bacterium]